MKDNDFVYDICLLPREKALSFADYLNSKSICVKAVPGAGGLWKICAAKSEVAYQAKLEAAAYSLNSGDPKYSRASWEQGRTIQAERSFKGGFYPFLTWRLFSAVSIVEILCVAVFLLQQLNEPVTLYYLSLTFPLADYGPWGVYRLVSPAFLHFGVLHLAFNLVMWEAIARSVERFCGTFKFTVLFLIIAVLSNYLQYRFLGDHEVFGGLSGAVYGMIGFAGILSRRKEFLNKLSFPKGLLAVSVIFMAAGFVFFDYQANFCHLGGLAAGMTIAFGEILLRRGKN